MSLSSSGVRAMAIKMLTVSQLERLHELEAKFGRALTGPEIAVFSGAGLISDYWGVPKDPRSQEIHADRIEAQLWDLVIVNHLSRSFFDEEARFKFDWQVYNSKIDFAFAGKNSAAKEIAAAGNDW